MINVVLTACKQFLIAEDKRSYHVVGTKRINGFLIFNENGSFDYEVYYGLANEHSSGSWNQQGRKIILNSHFQIDSTEIIQEKITGQESLIMKSVDLSGFSYETYAKLKDRNILIENGNVSLEYVPWDTIQVFYFNYLSYKLDTVFIVNQGDSNFVQVKRLNTFNFANYKFFSEEHVLKRMNKIVMHHSGFGRLAFKKD